MKEGGGRARIWVRRRRQMKTSSNLNSAVSTLKAHFNDRAYLRVPNPDRMDEGHEAYKKGFELRFVMDKRKDLTSVRKALADAGFRVAKAFEKNSKFVQPLYGREQVERCLKLMGESKRLKQAMREKGL